MQQQTQTNSATQKQDRTVTIKCTPTLVWHSVEPRSIGATMQYEEVESNPNMPNLVNEQTGDLNISKMPQNARFTDNVDITLLLDTSQLKDQDGNPIDNRTPGRWAMVGEGPWLTTPGGGEAQPGTLWFCNITNPGTREYDRDTMTEVDGMTWTRVDDLNIVIDDDTPDNAPSYGFCMGLVIPEYDNYFIGIDPVISTRGIGGEHFMMKE